MSERIKNNIIYLDNNGTTEACEGAAKANSKWIKCCGNPSGASKLSLLAKNMIDDTKNYITKHNKASEFDIVFTSGASESNCLIINSIIDSWILNVGKKPHIITSCIEHKSILLRLYELVKLKRVDVTFLMPDQYGIIHPNEIEKSIKLNTCLITIMFANNETGSINPVSKIGEIAHKHKIPFHTDATQIYGKYQLKLDDSTIVAMSCCMHKLYGVMGIGLLFVKKSLVHGFKLTGQISGTQQNGLRGGTENVPAIATVIPTLEYCFHNRILKNQKLSKMRQLFIEILSSKFSILEYNTFYKKEDGKIKTPLELNNGKGICILGAPEKLNLCNTILMSVVDFDHKFCNVKFKTLLEKNHIVISIGSACNTTSAKASHVLDAICAPSIIKRGVMRISFGDHNTLEETKKVADFINYALMSAKLDIYLD
jgi:cysteine desulfurase